MTDCNKCMRCDGTGRETFEEDGRMVGHTCYHCGGSKMVDDETYHHDLMMNVSRVLAHHAIERQIKNCNDDPDGEGWAFRAAENMLHEREYTELMKWDTSCSYGELLHTLPRGLQEALISALLPRRREAPTLPAPAPKVETAPTLSLGDDDIPF